MFSLALLVLQCTSDVVHLALQPKSEALCQGCMGGLHQFKQKICLCQAVLHIVLALARRLCLTYIILVTVAG